MLNINTVDTQDTSEYLAFVEKFKPKKTTDDCYTPPVVYDAVADWVVEEYGLDRNDFVRPFYPGCDYEHFNYSDNSVVVDNPPFSILSKICKFYKDKEIPFFLFAPSLTLFSTACGEMNYIVTDVDIIYENGAVVSTSFVTNLGDAKVRCCAELMYRLKDAVKVNKKELPKYDYPDCVITPSRLHKIVAHGIDFEVMPDECQFIRALDSQREKKKVIFGGGFLISERAAAERAAAERAAKKQAIIWELSAREKTIVSSLNKKCG